MTDAAIVAILKNRYQGERESTYAMLMQLVATHQIQECLHALEQMASTHIGCWRDVRGFIRHFEQHGDTNDSAAACALIQGCVRMTNAQLRNDHANANNRGSLAAKWVPREPKCRGLLKWYYDALAADMFPGAPDAKRRYRKLVSALSPPTTTIPASPTLAWFVKQALATNDAGKINALWQQHLARHMATPPLLPVLSLAHSMGPGHNNCLHAGIGLALHLLHLSSPASQSPSAQPSAYRILTFSSHAEWHTLENDDFVSQARQLFRAVCSPLNGLNANTTSVLSAALSAASAAPLLIISDMEHDEPESMNAQIMTWNVSRNGRPATICGDNPSLLQICTNENNENNK
jgi:hypothetical protein